MNLPQSKTPEVKWNIREHNLQFAIRMNGKPATIHGLPVALSNVYDPFGVWAPFVVDIRLIMQRLC